MYEFVARFSKPPLELLIVLKQPPLITLGNKVQLIQAGKLPMIFLDMRLQVMTLTLHDPNFLHQMRNLRMTGRTLLIPNRKIQLIPTHLIRMYLYILIQTLRIRLTHLVRLGHQFKLKKV